MVRDKSWVQLDDRRLAAYTTGCVDFLDYAFSHAALDGKIKCPCKACNNKKHHDYDTVHGHLLWKGMSKHYGEGRWFLHGEKEASVVEDVVLGQPISANRSEYMDTGEDMNQFVRACLHPTEADQFGVPIPEPDDFRRLIEEANTPLYSGCKDYSKLSFVIELYQIKARGKMSDKTFSETLQLLKKAFPHINVPNSFYETKKLITKLGCGYNKIDACENDCMLFWNENADLDSCTVCNASRWKLADSGNQSASVVRKRVPKKVLRHFPLIPRLQRLFMAKKTAKNMRWHAELRSDDGTLRHPADSTAWKEFDKNHQLFSSEIRNVRLGLASDGFNPFGNMSSSYSTWPVVVVVYNLPPEMCMQRDYMMMSLLISGSKGPHNNIDVYLQPLVKELNQLWGPGVITLDAYTKEHFQMRATLMWTINDFPAYANLSGYNTVGYLACPSCAENTVSEHLSK